MALVPDLVDLPPPPEPITPRQAIEDLLIIIARIRHKLRTMIDWYIYPGIVPSEIEAYDPRLLILRARLESLASLSYEHLPYITDEADARAGYYLGLAVDQMLNSVLGIQKIFSNHYDRELDDKRPFAAIWETLDYRSLQLKEMSKLAPSNPRRQRPEDLRPNELGQFCRGALQISNKRDRGRISFVERKDLSEDNEQTLKAFGGAYLNWQCPECSFKVRYHVASSATSSIHSTDEVREHSGVKVQYRSSFLAKCHLYLPLSDKKSTSASAIKYGCVFCFACGKGLDRDKAAFTNPQAFAEHLEAKHRKTLPATLMLHRYDVAVAGRTEDPKKRWDLNLV
ncbi:hypothetical protein PV08_00896 [Exophiala spinifera]|uniref:C2H2-type domain-containing protein n=1 Tax=Exophiala spinifera TaxID=91928 RepID=A0A0D1YYF4_9EURO|nr:uncharacterized protein PV08_00896 [Exophiala spinifera]KIW20321.1 hypothetical protein PV08_00896 [Exophiala spinifera]